ncbi:MAG: FecR domain-containing protein [Acetivibrio sp.]
MREKNSVTYITKARIKYTLVLVLLTFVFAVTLRPVTIAAKKAEATSMRLEKTEGTVNLTTQNGLELPIREKGKLYSGYTLSTKSASYAYVSLDDKKAIKLDESSKVSVKKKGKKIELYVISGKIFFNVKEPLKNDETMQIRTSNMVTGIRGTSAIVEVVDANHTIVSLLDGKVMLISKDMETDEWEEILLTAGEVADIRSIVNTTEKPESTVTVKKMEENSIPGFASLEILKDITLQERITEDTKGKFDLLQIILQAEERLKKDQEEARKRKKDIDESLSEREKGKGSESVSESPIIPDEDPIPMEDITLTGADITFEKFSEAIKTYKNITLNVTDATYPMKFTSTLEIPTADTVTINSAANTPLTFSLGNKDAGKLINNGTLHLNTKLINQVSIKNNTGAVMTIKGQLVNDTEAAFENMGTIKDEERTNPEALIANAGVFTMTSGSVESKNTTALENAGTMDISGSTKITGGSNGILNLGGGNLTVHGLGTVITGKDSGITSNGILTIRDGATVRGEKNGIVNNEIDGHKGSLVLGSATVERTGTRESRTEYAVNTVTEFTIEIGTTPMIRAKIKINVCNLPNISIPKGEWNEFKRFGTEKLTLTGEGVTFDGLKEAFDNYYTDVTLEITTATQPMNLTSNLEISTRSAITVNPAATNPGSLEIAAGPGKLVNNGMLKLNTDLINNCQMENNGTITLHGVLKNNERGVFNNTGIINTRENNSADCIENAGKFVMSRGKITFGEAVNVFSNKGELTVEDGTIENLGSTGIGINNSGTTNIAGGTIKAWEAVRTTNKMTITGGNIMGVSLGVHADTGDLTMNGSTVKISGNERAGLELNGTNTKCHLLNGTIESTNGYALNSKDGNTRYIIEFSGATIRAKDRAKVCSSLKNYFPEIREVADGWYILMSLPQLN